MKDEISANEVCDFLDDMFSQSPDFLTKYDVENWYVNEDNQLVVEFNPNATEKQISEFTKYIVNGDELYDGVMWKGKSAFKSVGFEIEDANLPYNPED